MCSVVYQEQGHDERAQQQLQNAVEVFFKVHCETIACNLKVMEFSLKNDLKRLCLFCRISKSESLSKIKD